MRSALPTYLNSNQIHEQIFYSGGVYEQTVLNSNANYIPAFLSDSFDTIATVSSATLKRINFEKLQATGEIEVLESESLDTSKFIVKTNKTGFTYFISSAGTYNFSTITMQSGVFLIDIVLSTTDTIRTGIFLMEGKS